MIQSVTISRRVMTLDWPLFPVQPNGYLRTPLIVYVVSLIENSLQQLVKFPQKTTRARFSDILAAFGSDITVHSTNQIKDNQLLYKLSAPGIFIRLIIIILCTVQYD